MFSALNLTFEIYFYLKESYRIVIIKYIVIIKLNLLNCCVSGEKKKLRNKLIFVVWKKKECVCVSFIL